MWKEHGTKILGAITTLLGLLATLDATVLEGYFGTWAPAAGAMIAGLLVIFRGFSNTAAIERGEFK